MSKNKTKNHQQVNVRQLIERDQEIGVRIEEIADVCQAEDRERNDEEEKEFRTLMKERQILRMKLDAINTPAVKGVRRSATAQLRDLVNAPNPMRGASIVLLREDATVETPTGSDTGSGSDTVSGPALMTTAGLEGTGIIPVSEQEMLKPLRAGMIYDKVGLSIRTGLPGQTLRWPKHTKAVAYFAEEGERAVDSKIEFDKLTTTPRRITSAIPVTREELESSGGLVENVIREEMPAAILDLVNDAMFSPSATFTDEDGNEKTRKVVGPFVEAAKKPFEFAGDVPTRRELLLMKAQVATAGIPLTYACWVMTETMKAELEDAKVDAGSGRFICENDRILGLPVFTTPFIGEGNVGFGEWSYQAAGFFGTTSLLVDPYTLARQNSTDFVINGHFATVTLRQEAFVLGHKKVVKS